MKAKVIKTKQEYEAALGRIEKLMDKAQRPEEVDELELLALLVEAYEDEHHTIGLPSPVDAIRFRMEQAGLRQRDLVSFIGSRSKVSEVLSGARPLSLRMIRALHEGLGIPSDVLLQETSSRRAGAHLGGRRGGRVHHRTRGGHAHASR
jgi:HTH-type transcriptional regulator/antitoxin HigA